MMIVATEEILLNRMVDGLLEVDCRIEQSHCRCGHAHQGKATMDQAGDDATLIVTTPPPKEITNVLTHRWRRSRRNT